MMRKSKNETFIDDYADAIAVVLQAATPLIIGLSALGCGTILMREAIASDSGNRFIAASQAATGLFGAGVGGVMGAIQPGIRDRRKRNSRDLEINESGEGDVVINSEL